MDSKHAVSLIHRCNECPKIEKEQEQTVFAMARDSTIRLPNGDRISAKPGKYNVVPPPDLRLVSHELRLLEYIYPTLIVRELALPKTDAAELTCAEYQASMWEAQHTGGYGGFIGSSRFAYALPGGPSGRFHWQLAPSLSYIGPHTWNALSREDLDETYVPCAPTVAIGIVTSTESYEELQDKIRLFVQAGTQEGVVVDTRNDRVWIYNNGEDPVETAPLASVEFDYWPGFILDCHEMKEEIETCLD